MANRSLNMLTESIVLSTSAITYSGRSGSECGVETSNNQSNAETENMVEFSLRECQYEGTIQDYVCAREVHFTSRSNIQKGEFVDLYSFPARLIWLTQIRSDKRQWAVAQSEPVSQSGPFEETLHFTETFTCVARPLLKSTYMCLKYPSPDRTSIRLQHNSDASSEKIHDRS